MLWDGSHASIIYPDTSRMNIQQTLPMEANTRDGADMQYTQHLSKRRVKFSQIHKKRPVFLFEWFSDQQDLYSCPKTSQKTVLTAKVCGSESVTFKLFFCSFLFFFAFVFRTLCSTTIYTPGCEIKDPRNITCNTPKVQLKGPA